MERKTPDIPRKADGKPNLIAPAPRAPNGKPDFTGCGTGPPPRPSRGRRPPAGDERPRPQAAAGDLKARPAYQCRPGGPEAEKFGGWKRVLQTPTAIAILSDDLTYRVIHMDGRTLEANPAPNWMGYSVGRWEGDTLVVDSNGFNEKTWASRYGVSHTEAMRITERYRRSDFGHLQAEVTFTDPRVFVKPWSVKSRNGARRRYGNARGDLRKEQRGMGRRSLGRGEYGRIRAARVLARYVGVYRGIYSGKKRTVEVTLSGGELIATLVGDDVEGGLGAAGLDEAVPRPLMPLSDTLFEGLGLGYQFVVDDKGVATRSRSDPRIRPV